MTFIFYDTETTGLAAGYDQILQFAAIVTDDDFNVLEESNLRCRFLPHVVPSPTALIVTHVLPSDVEKAPLSHYEMIRAIRALFEKYKPVVSVGYNSISFDEGMLRHAFYQTLNPIYLTNTKGNMRMDALRAAHAASEFAPGVLTIPTDDKGKERFKLELLAPANGLIHDDAHEAMSDTHATLELARLIRGKAPRVWEALYRMRSKQGALDFLEEEEVFCCTDMMFGQSSIMATKLAVNPDNGSEVVVFDLSHDSANYLDIPQKDAASLLKTSPRPIRIVKTSQQPILMPADLRNERVAGHDLPMEELRDRARRVKEHPTFGAYIAQAVANRYEERQPSAYVEDRMYDGFPSYKDSALMEEFHAVPWEERWDVVSRIEDERMRELGQRLIYLERPDVLDKETRARFDAWRRKRMMTEGEVPWDTVASVRREVAELRAEDDGTNAALLDEIEGLVEAVYVLMG